MTPQKWKWLLGPLAECGNGTAKMEMAPQKWKWLLGPLAECGNGFWALWQNVEMAFGPSGRMWKWLRKSGNGFWALWQNVEMAPQKWKWLLGRLAECGNGSAKVEMAFGPSGRMWK